MKVNFNQVARKSSKNVNLDPKNSNYKNINQPNDAPSVVEAKAINNSKLNNIPQNNSKNNNSGGASRLIDNQENQEQERDIKQSRNIFRSNSRNSFGDVHMSAIVSPFNNESVIVESSTSIFEHNNNNNYINKNSNLINDPKNFSNYNIINYRHK